MDKLTEQDGKSKDIVSENIEALKSIFPDSFTEDGVNFETLRQLLGDAVNDQEEKFGLNWHGKKRARQIALMPSTGTLLPCLEESEDWETTHNLFIEGDNLEVLKLLQKSYANSIQMIYIDPPYNTGKDFIYKDNYADNLKNYLQYTDQQSQDGYKISSNVEASGRFHTNWLNMMYPRLKLAQKLLTKEGVILISISDFEVANTLAVMDEIYGVENRVAIFTWKSRAKPTNAGNAKYRPQKVAEYVVVYGRQPGDELTFNVVPSTKRTYPHSDKIGKYRITTILTSNRGTFRRETMRLMNDIRNTQLTTVIIPVL